MKWYIIGYVAAFLTSFSMIPQIIRLVKLKESKDVSLAMTMALCLGVLLWLLYGIAINNTPVIVANAVSFCVTATTVILVIRYR
jgi:MtN3 and saliva related transmembrane protein